MRNVKPLDAEHLLPPPSHMVAGGTSHATNADHNHIIPWWHIPPSVASRVRCVWVGEHRLEQITINSSAIVSIRVCGKRNSPPKGFHLDISLACISRLG